MWIIAITLFVALGACLVAVGVREKAKSKEREEGTAIERYIKEFGCSPEEMARKVATSPSVETLAVAVLNLPIRPKGIAVSSSDLMCNCGHYECIYFRDCGIANIPEDCCSVLAETLANTSQLSPYYYAAPGTYDGKCYLILKETSPEPDLTNW